jgi:hypothetical protein
MMLSSRNNFFRQDTPLLKKVRNIFWALIYEKFIAGWLDYTDYQLPHYADHRVAPFRRSPGGSFTAITGWLDFGDPEMAL